MPKAGANGICERCKKVLLLTYWKGVGMLWINTRWMHLVSVHSRFKDKLDKVRQTRVGFL